ncbi:MULTISPECIES: phytoene desaturase family protein [Micromonospora]|uniref:Phytoene desaturase family protein n=1 Tax=Micromonospora zamorensis TaxID=709883 RepID=A0ABZ1PD24_9ACTN|nr:MULTISPECIES: phytoene desaturase family protein [Micromonospora]MBQ1036258.1 phytoene desaturase [Micromonospora sp. C81]WSK45982.1 phytoene desaturase family protein [Micromonospora zamorensis]WTE85345.1 phytoene desaturase family protein [Micromonospora zamorensis]WTI20129.1 phytoene desaturase family protein [Micromonospora zamorensis]SCG69280.1 phytoene desaturase [Micromonospora zamorensis]
MRTVTGRTDRVVVVGAGLGGLACALHLAGSGRQVTVLEREPVPGGRAGRLGVDGYEFDTGPTVLTMPDLIAEALGAVGEELDDWLDLTPVDPAYRAYYPDGSTLDVLTDTTRMAAEISRVCGPREADGYLRFVDYARELWRLERADFIERNLDAPTDLITGNLLKLLASGAFRRLQTKINQFFRDPRTQRIFSFQAMYAGLAPHDALAIYTVIAYLDSVAGVYFPRGGIHAVSKAMAGAAEKHGVQIRYGTTVTRVETANGRATGVITADGELVPADVVVLNPDLPVAYRDLLPAAPQRRLTYSPSCVVLHVGSRQGYEKIAHHNIHFGRAWKGTFDEVIRRGELMTDPSLLVTNPSRTDPSVAPPDRHTYYVLAPVPNLHRAPFEWRGDLTRRYSDQLIGTLEERGYVGFGAGVEVLRAITPAEWEDQGMAAGTPFAAAHTLFQTGPFRPSNLHRKLSNVVFVGSGTQPGVGVPMVLISGKLAAGRITGEGR